MLSATKSSGLPIAAISPACTLGALLAFLFQIRVEVLALHDRGQEHRVLFPRRLGGSRDMLGGLDHGHVEDGVVGQPDLNVFRRMRADRLHT